MNISLALIRLKVGLLTHNREYWNASLSVVVCRLSVVANNFFTGDFSFNKIMHMVKLLMLITSVRVKIQLNL